LPNLLHTYFVDECYGGAKNVRLVKVVDPRATGINNLTSLSLPVWL